MGSVRIKRVYEAAAPADGCRILVDGIWPRGVSRERAQLDRWMPEVAPSGGLRRWYGHEVARWPDFRSRYRAELVANPALLELSEIAAAGPTTLLYSARDTEHNQAVVLAEVLGEL